MKTIYRILIWIGALAAMWLAASWIQVVLHNFAGTPYQAWNAFVMMVNAFAK